MSAYVTAAENGGDVFRKMRAEEAKREREAWEAKVKAAAEAQAGE